MNNPSDTDPIKSGVNGTRRPDDQRPAPLPRPVPAAASTTADDTLPRRVPEATFSDNPLPEDQ